MKSTRAKINEYIDLSILNYAKSNEWDVSIATTGGCTPHDSDADCIEEYVKDTKNCADEMFLNMGIEEFLERFFEDDNQRDILLNYVTDKSDKGFNEWYLDKYYWEV